MEPEDDSGVNGTPHVYLQRGDTLVKGVLKYSDFPQNPNSRGFHDAPAVVNRETLGLLRYFIAKFV